MTPCMKPLARICAVAVLASVSSALVGCPAASLRDAQTHFSAGASAENRQTIEELTRYQLGIPELSEQQAVVEYRLACETADDLIRTRANGLRQDKLLGTTQMIQVYSMWRILALEGEQGAGEGMGQCALGFDGLSALSKQIVRDHEANRITLGTRDAVMARAMPGFLDHERGLAATSWTEADRRFCSAIRLYSEAARGAPADHSVRAYLDLAQLQGIGAWLGKAAELSETPPLKQQRWAAIRPFVGPAFCDLEAYTKVQEPAGQGPVTRLKGKQIQNFGLSPGDFACTRPQVLPDSCPSDTIR